jgi:DNA repair exonuclease SbcCD ATPase subunit
MNYVIDRENSSQEEFELTEVHVHHSVEVSMVEEEMSKSRIKRVADLPTGELLPDKAPKPEILATSKTVPVVQSNDLKHSNDHDGFNTDAITQPDQQQPAIVGQNYENQEKQQQLQEENRPQLQEEKQQLQEEKQQLQVEKQQLQEEKQQLQVEKQQLQVEKQQLQVEKQQLQEEKQQLQVEKQQLQEEKQQLNEQLQQMNQPLYEAKEVNQK